MLSAQRNAWLGTQADGGVDAQQALADGLAAELAAARSAWVEEVDMLRGVLAERDAQVMRLQASQGCKMLPTRACVYTSALLIGAL
jgi:hypothetical protein